MNSKTSVDTQLDEIVRENKIYRFAHELQSTTDVERKKLITNKLKLIQGSTQEEMDKEAGDKLSVIRNNMNTFSLKQKWSKLTKLQKKDRIKQFIDASKYDSDKKKKTETKLLTMVDNNTLKVSFIEYDEETSKIKNITLE